MTIPSHDVRSRPMLAAIISCAALLFAGCEAAPLTQIVVETETDYAIGSELAAIEWEIIGSDREPIDPRPRVELAPGDEELFPLTLTLVPTYEGPSVVTVVARGFDAEGRLLVAQELRTSFSVGVSAVLHLDLSRVCAGRACSGGQTCAPAGNEARCTELSVASDTLPAFRPGRGHGAVELCNGRDDDGNAAVDDGFDHQNDALHCGGCFQACPADAEATGDPMCSAGACGFRCLAGRADCNGSAADSCETDLASPGSCGGCGVVCGAATPYCDQGTLSCVDGCTGDDVACGGTCTDIETDPNHCGSCGAACPAPGLGGSLGCVLGTCSPDCEAGSHACGAYCRADDDVASCGARCEACPSSGPNVAAGACAAGDCALVCVEGFSDCDGDPGNGCETSTASDPTSCGACGLDCGYGTCRAGLCSNRVVHFETGPRHACADLADGTHWCWGANERGQLGNGAPSPFEPLPVRANIEPPSLDGGTHRVVALDDRTSYYRNDVGWSTPFASGSSPSIVALGESPIDPSLEPLTAPLELLTGLSAHVVFAAGGGSGLAAGVFSYPIVPGSPIALHGLGATAHDALAMTTGAAYVGSTRIAMDLPFANDATWGALSERGGSPIARGPRASCAAGPDGDLSCWGTGGGDRPAYIGVLGSTGASSPRRVSPFASGLTFDTDAGVHLAETVGCASFTARDGQNRWYCWGDWGGCGSFALSPTVVPGPGAAVELDSYEFPRLGLGGHTACAITSPAGERHELVCWGDDLIDGTCIARPTAPFGGWTDVLEIGVGDGYACALRGPDTATGGALYCWGRDELGQLGRGAPSSTPRGPARVVFESGP